MSVPRSAPILAVPLLVLLTTCSDTPSPVAPEGGGIRAARGGVPGANPDRPGGGGSKEEDGAYALSFDGITQHASTPDADDLDLTTTWTLEAWIKPSNVAASFQPIVSKWNGGGDASYNMVVHQGYLRSSIHDGSASQGENSSSTLADNTWQHVAITVDDGTWRFYINGVLDRTVATVLIPMNSTRPISLGREGPPANIQYFAGQIDEVRIWNVARTATEIANGMDDGVSTQTPGLVAYWKLDEGKGQKGRDATGKGHDMILGDDPKGKGDAADPLWVPVPKVASVLVSPVEADLLVGTSAQLQATLLDRSGNPITDRTVVWASNDDAVAAVDANGLVDGVAAGAAAITAESEGQVGTAMVTIVAHCPLPLAVPNRWTETDGNEVFVGPPNDLYIPYAGSGTQCVAGTGPPGNGCDFTGFYPGSVNDPLEPLFEVKTQSGPPNKGNPPEGPDYVASPCVDGGWRCWIVPGESSGAAALISWISGCPDPSVTITVDDLLNPESGNVQSAVMAAFKELIDLNLAAAWNDSHPSHPSGGCATIDGGDGPCLGSENPRIRFMAITKTDQMGTSSTDPAPAEGLACVFLDKVASDFDLAHGGGTPGTWKLYWRLTDTCLGLVEGEGPIVKVFRP